jgi:Mg2+/Co2+ transporter CorB
MGALIAAVLVVLIGSALCSGTETALLSVPEIRVRQLADDGGRSARALVGIKQRIARPISAIVVLNNIFNIVGSIAVGTIAADVFGDRWVGVVSGVLTFLVILFAEIMPKTLGERYAERASLAVAIPVRWLTAVMTPLVVVLEVAHAPAHQGRARAIDQRGGDPHPRPSGARSEGVLEDARGGDDPAGLPAQRPHGP